MRIPLTQGKFAIVGPRDYTFLIQWKWHYSSWGYGVRTDNINKQVILMHRVILERMGFKNFTHSDHINQNRLDNRRNNLRPATASQNKCNRGKQIDNTSGYKGVDWNYGKWRAQIKLNGKSKCLGHYDDKLDAARAYNEAAIKYHGKFACLNKV